jgi:photosystem II stability/assembly factor-like uncharacterized protein
MKSKIFCLLAIFLPSLLYCQSTSTIVYDSGTTIDIGTGADVCADLITVNGSLGGNGHFCDGSGLSLISSPNGGETWKVGSTHAITWSSFVSNVTLEYSTNNGSSWSTIVSSIPATPGSYDWLVPNTLTTQTLVRITNAADNSLLDVSDAVFTISQTFLSQVSGTNKHLNDVSFVSTTTGWAVGDKVIIHTTNGGAQWSDQTQYLGSQTLKNIQWTGVSFVDANNGWVVGPSGSDAKVIKTIDGGLSWQVLITISNVIPNDVTFSDLTHGWLVGNNGKIFYTVNGGANWTEVSSPTAQHLNGVSIIQGTTYTGYAVGAAGTVLKTTNGTSWSVLTENIYNQLNDMSFVDVNNGWVVGNNGTILITADAGATWQTQPSGTSVHLNGVSFVNSTLGWAVGNNGTILRYDFSPSQSKLIKNSSTSSIPSWTLVLSGATGDLDAVLLIGSDLGFFIGDSGTVLSYSPAVVLPVELTSFTASVKGSTVELQWRTATEINNYGFEIERTVISNQSVNRWNKIGFVEGAGTTNAPREYSFNDKNISVGKYSYRLKQIDRDGKFKYSQQVEINASVAPKDVALGQNYPNPFNPTTVIRYQLSVSSYVTLKVYDVLGREVVSLVNELEEAGTHSLSFDASKLSSGLYYYTLRSGEFVATKAMVLMK